MNTLITCITLVTLLAIGCSKKDSTSGTSKKDLLTTGSWKLTAVMADNDANGTYEMDEFASFSNCFKDNYYTFGTTGVMEMNEGVTKCSPTDPQTEAGTWLFTQNESHLKVNADEWKLEELTTTTLKWKESYSGGRSALVTFTKR